MSWLRSPRAEAEPVEAGVEGPSTSGLRPCARAERAAWLTAFALLLGACAGARGGACPTGFRFPDTFDAVQVIRVRSDGELREMLGSVSRRGEDFQIAFLDPALQRPFLEIEIKAGKIAQKGDLPQEAREQIPKLIDAIRELYSASCFQGTEDKPELTGSRFRYWLERVEGPADCRFAMVTRMAPRIGSSVAIEVETSDVGCRVE